MDRISSRTNPVVKAFRAAARTEDDLILLDGEHLLSEALACGVTVELVALEDRLVDHHRTLVRDARAAGARTIGVTEPVLAAISPVRQPSGIVAVARRPVTPLPEVFAATPQLVLILAAIQDPGNAGAIIRAADACGATGIVAAEGTADVFGWKALRGAMGSTFRLPVATGVALQVATAAARERGVRVLAAVPRGGSPLPACDLRHPSAVLLGGEGAGLPAGLVADADARISIPMRGRVESLNVAAAAAIVTYEALRQRQGVIT